MATAKLSSWRRRFLSAALCSALSVVGCEDSETESPGVGPLGGSAGTSSAGTGGAGGASGGFGGLGGAAGNAGSGNNGGGAGDGGGGDSGASGEGGSGAEGGAGGSGEGGSSGSGADGGNGGAGAGGGGGSGAEGGSGGSGADSGSGASGGTAGSGGGSGGTAGGGGSGGTSGVGGSAGTGGSGGAGGGGGNAGTGGVGGSGGTAGASGTGGAGGSAGSGGTAGTGGLGGSGGSGGDDVVAESCLPADVQSALDSAPDGAKVVIPEGDCDWEAATVTRAAGVSLRGAGKGKTILRRSAPVTAEANFMLEFDCANGKTVELSDLTIFGNDDLQSEEQRLEDVDNGVLLENSCHDFKIHDAEFSKFSNGALTIRGKEARGVIYLSDFISNFKCQPSPVSCLGYGVVVYGGPEPRPELELGSENAVFVEDNYFHDNRHAVASNQGSRYVLRRNQFVTTERARNFGIIDAHGRGSYPPGSRSWEIYENTLETDFDSLSATGIALRGGDGVIFSNILSERFPYVASLRDESGCSSGTYPLPDQITEAHIWDNEPIGPVSVPTACEDFIQEGRDYFLVPRPGYTPYAYPHPLR